MSRPTHCCQIASSLSRAGGFTKRLDLWTIVDGAVALYVHEDGNAYEVIVRPASEAKFRGLFSRFIGKARRPYRAAPVL